MAEPLWHGESLLGSLLEDVPAEINFDRYGIASASLVYQCKYDLAPGLVATVKQHPQFPWLLRKQAKITREESNLGRVRIDFEGIPPETNDKIYRLTGTLDSQPIESHPDFISKIGGTKDDPINGAIFDAKGKFKGFAAESAPGTVNEKGGIKSYLSPSLVYEEVWTTGSSLGLVGVLASLGEIDTPPASNCLPTGISGRNWMLSKGDAEQVGTGLKLTRGWRLSGKRGWDTDVYQH